jgi:CDP-diacylglycerol--glycerol-3-phosphate 3-phosphatidyltransferase
LNVANMLTISRILLSPVFLIFMQFDSFGWRLAATLIFAFAALTDLADGYFARRMGHQTGFGKFMDPLADKILVSTAFLTFIGLGYARDWMVIIIVVREFLITGLRSMAAYRGLVIVPSMLAKWKTATQMTVAIVIMSYGAAEPLLRQSNSPLLQIPAWTLPLFHWNYNLFDAIIFVPLFMTVWTGLDYLLKSGTLLKGMLK